MPGIIDITMPMSKDSQGLEIRLHEELPVYMGHDCYAYDLCVKSHHGTYFESPSHVFRNTKDTCDYMIDELILPGICLKLDKTDNRCIDAGELALAAEDIDIQTNSALLVETIDTAEGFRYFSRDTAVWMAGKGFKLFGSNSERYDSGFETPTGFFIELFHADIPIIANITNGGCLTVVFTSDDGITREGWEASVTCGPAPTCVVPSEFIVDVFPAPVCPVNTESLSLNTVDISFSVDGLLFDIS